MSSGPIPAVRDPSATLLECRGSGNPATGAWVSTSVRDDAWDRYLQEVSLGHFQQSAIWASIKALEDWRVIRVVIWEADQIIGGFQILVRDRGWLREGFLNKGPVWKGDDRWVLEWLFHLIEKIVKINRIDALIAQAADADPLGAAFMRDSPSYATNAVAKIITATFCIPLGPTLASAESRMRRTIRLEARQALKRGVIVREGGAADIPTFFQMMCTTCRRQETSPNPPTEQALLALWNAFHANGLARLTIADCDGKPTAGLLAIRFGDRVTQWKKGWTEEYREKHPNTLLAVESIRWSEENGARIVDFVGGDRSYARSLLAGQAPTQSQLASRYFFIVGLGAEPQILPLGHVLIRNPLGRAAYRISLPVLRKLGNVEV